MSNTVWLIIMLMMVLFFTICALKDRPRDPPRRDDRDFKKSQDASRAQAVETNDQ